MQGSGPTAAAPRAETENRRNRPLAPFMLLAALAVETGALAEEAKSEEAQCAPERVELTWQIDAKFDMEAGAKAGLEARGFRILPPPPLEPMRAWKLPDGSEQISHDRPLPSEGATTESAEAEAPR